MSDKFSLDVVQAAELKYAFERNGYTNADVKALSGGDLLARLLPVVRGQGEVVQATHVIDCDANPFLPYEDWTVEEHRKGGQFTWDPMQLRLYLSESQLNGRYIEGHKLREELADNPVLNANVLDYLLKHPHLIPEDWKKDEHGNARYIFFWGTIYRSSVGHLCVRCLYFPDGGWDWYYGWLDYAWYSAYPAVLRAS